MKDLHFYIELYSEIKVRTYQNVSSHCPDCPGSFRFAKVLHYKLKYSSITCTTAVNLMFYSNYESTWVLQMNPVTLRDVQMVQQVVTPDTVSEHRGQNVQVTWQEGSPCSSCSLVVRRSLLSDQVPVCSHGLRAWSSTFRVKKRSSSSSQYVIRSGGTCPGCRTWNSIFIVFDHLKKQLVFKRWAGESTGDWDNETELFQWLI